MGGYKFRGKLQKEKCLFVRNSVFLRRAEKQFFKGEKWEYKNEG